jgi:hypothetical protein
MRAGMTERLEPASTALLFFDMLNGHVTSPEQDNHAQFMRRVFPRMARVRTVDQIVRMLTKEET